MTCKKCPSQESFDSTETEALVADQLALETELVSDALYQDRIAKCFSCSRCIAGHTCASCGCFVQFRARLSKKDCPHPAGTRWV
ncbi:DUF6171 family protein [Shouchella shacheensis]|uniref:DUF6171 family protein n=1 Tax=Shouchella shacheensis TaxID=1649580 RepID=UPI00346282E8